MEVNVTENSRVKICINTGEFEFEGSEAFVKSQLSALPDMLEKLFSYLPGKVSTIPQAQKFTEDSAHVKVPLTPKTENDALNIPDSFGEWHNKFPKKIQQVDLVLLTGYYQQKKSDGNAFETGEITSLLKEQGIKVSNPAVFLKLLQQSKLAIIIEKRGSLNRFRISPDGESHVKELLQLQ
jgi:hypothetical protein